MAAENFIYQERAVAFLDVLGFQQKLIEFENEAIARVTEEQSTNFEDLNKGQYLISTKANDFISTYLDAISGLNRDKFQYYLFSDNICITVRQPDDKSLLIELLNTICDLFYSLAKKGYFLRGGIDFGNFINQDTIALGTPLATAYKMEQNDAIYPRVLISERFRKVFEEHGSSANQLYVNSLILKSCEMYYLNVFLKVFNMEDKEVFFKTLSESIKANLETNSNNEKIYIKYEWLATEFDNFIDMYVSELAYIDENFEPADDFLENIKSLKIF